LEDSAALNGLFKCAYGPGYAEKEVTFWIYQPGGSLLSETFSTSTDLYPQYPDYFRSPQSNADRDGSTLVAGVKRYFHNATSS